MSWDFLKNKWTWIVAGAVAVLGVLIWFGFNWGKSSSGAAKIPGENENTPLTDEERMKARDLASRLYKDIDRWLPFLGRDTEAYNALLVAPDRVFVAVFNVYQSEYKRSLSADIAEETGITAHNVATMKQIIERAKKYNL